MVFYADLYFPFLAYLRWTQSDEGCTCLQFRVGHKGHPEQLFSCIFCKLQVLLCIMAVFGRVFLGEEVSPYEGLSSQGWLMAKFLLHNH